MSFGQKLLLITTCYFCLLLLSISFPCPLAAELGINYDVTISGVDDSELRGLLEAVSDAFVLREQLPPTMNLLRSRVNKDISRQLQVLRAQGFYGARVKANLDTQADPVQVVFQVEPGPAYLIQSVDIQTRGVKKPVEIQLPEASELGLVLGEPARAKDVVSAKKELIYRLKKVGFPFPRMDQPKLIVDHATRTVRITLQVDQGLVAHFGPTNISGPKTVDEVFLRNKIPWQEGDLFNVDLLKEGKSRLSETGLFATVRVETEKAVDDKGLLPVTVKLKERKHRTVSASISYTTDEGPGVKTSWEHRNLLRCGERLGVDLTVSDITFGIESTFRKSQFLRPDQSLVLNFGIAKETPDAFTSRSLNGSAMLERAITNKIKLGGGLGLKFSKVDQLGKEEEFHLLSFPGLFDWDTSNDILNPSNGMRLAMKLTPFIETFDSDVSFVRGYTSCSKYLKLADTPPLVLAGRVALGGITGASRDAIPADERFYVGGGGSIRGYAFQSVGPLSAGEPVGGRSLVELSGELRLKVTRTLGLVTFLDGGNAFKDAFPDFGEDMRWAAGLGVRYFTFVGPFRLDVGIPINRREEVDDCFQIYVSIGHAF